MTFLVYLIGLCMVGLAAGFAIHSVPLIFGIIGAGLMFAAVIDAASNDDADK